MKGLRLVKLLVLALSGLVVGFSAYRQFEAQHLKQPYAFNHAAHRPMACDLCHAGVYKSVRAGLPSLDFCLKCHATSPLVNEMDAWQEAIRAAGIRWRKLTSVPEHVFFSHRRHTTSAGLPCQRCHGPMDKLTSPPRLPLQRVRMNACLDCHRELEASTDCARCHK